MHLGYLVKFDRLAMRQIWATTIYADVGLMQESGISGDEPVSVLGRLGMGRVPFNTSTLGLLCCSNAYSCKLPQRPLPTILKVDPRLL